MAKAGATAGGVCLSRSKGRALGGSTEGSSLGVKTRITPLPGGSKVGSGGGVASRVVGAVSSSGATSLGGSIAGGGAAGGGGVGGDGCGGGAGASRAVGRARSAEKAALTRGGKGVARKRWSAVTTRDARASGAVAGSEHRCTVGHQAGASSQGQKLTRSARRWARARLASGRRRLKQAASGPGASSRQTSARASPTCAPAAASRRRRASTAAAGPVSATVRPARGEAMYSAPASWCQGSASPLAMTRNAGKCSGAAGPSASLPR